MTTAIINFHQGNDTVSFYDHQHGDVWNLGDEIRLFCQDDEGHGLRVENFQEFTHDLVAHLAEGGWLDPANARQSAHADLLYNISLAENGQVLLYLYDDQGTLHYRGRAKDSPFTLSYRL